MFLHKTSSNSIRFPAIALFFILLHPFSFSEDIATFAHNALREVQSIESEIDSRQIEESINKNVASLTREQRMEFIEEVTRAAASVDSGDKKGALFSALALIKMSETTTQDKALALSRLFEDSDPRLNKIAEGFLKNYCLDTGPSEDLLSRLSVFRSIFEERSHAANAKLIAFLFRLMPIEAASWLADNIEMSDDERAMLTKEIDLAHRIVKNAQAPLQAPTWPTLTNAVREQKLQEWAMGHSWIMQFVSKSLLEKYPPWMTPDLKIATAIVKVPATIKLRVMPFDQTSGEVSAIKIPTPPVTPSSVSDDTVTKERKAYVSWPWVLAVSAIVIMSVIFVMIKKRHP